MATASGTGTGTSGASSYTARLDVWEESYNVNENYSTVSYNLWLDSTSYNFYDYNIPVSISINDNVVWAGSPRLGMNKYQSILIASGSVTVYHDNDGSKRINFSASISNTSAYYLPGNIYVSESMNLTTIPRASEPSLSKSPFDIGETITIYTNRKSNNFTHKIYFNYGTSKILLSDNVATSYKFNSSDYIDLFYKFIPDSASGFGNFSVETYNGSLHIGTKSVNFEAKVPNDIVPTIDEVIFSETLMEKNANGYIQGKSTITYKITASGVKGSTIKSYKIEINKEIHELSEDTTGLLSTPGKNTCKITVTDTRNMKAVMEKEFIVLEYSKPVISSFNCERNTDDETQVDFSYEIKTYNLNYSNAWNVYVFALPSGTFLPEINSFEDINNIKGKIGGHERFGRDDTYGASSFFKNLLEAESSYDFYCIVIDYLGGVTIEKFEVGTADELINFSADGKNVAIGQVYDTKQGGRLQIKGKIVVDGQDITKYIALALYPVGSIYMSSEYSSPEFLFGGKWESIDDINGMHAWKRIE